MVALKLLVSATWLNLAASSTEGVKVDNCGCDGCAMETIGYTDKIKYNPEDGGKSDKQCIDKCKETWNCKRVLLTVSGCRLYEMGAKSLTKGTNKEMCWVKHEACLTSLDKDCGGKATKPTTTKKQDEPKKQDESTPSTKGVKVDKCHCDGCAMETIGYTDKIKYNPEDGGKSDKQCIDKCKETWNCKRVLLTASGCRLYEMGAKSLTSGTNKETCWVKHEACLTSLDKDCGGKAMKPAATTTRSTTEAPTEKQDTEKQDTEKQDTEKQDAEKQVKTTTTATTTTLGSKVTWGFKQKLPPRALEAWNKAEAALTNQKKSRRLFGKKVVKKLEFILPLPAAYKAEEVVAWIGGNEDQIKTELAKIMKEYTLDNLMTVSAIGASTVTDAVCAKAKKKAGLTNCLKGSVTAEIPNPLSAFGFLAKAAKAAMEDAAADQKKEIKEAMKKVVAAVFGKMPPLDELVKLLFMILPDPAKSGRRLQAVESLKAEARRLKGAVESLKAQDEMEVVIEMTPPSDLPVGNLAKIAKTVTPDALATSINKELKQVCPDCDDVVVTALVEPKAEEVCKTETGCVEAADSAMRTGCWSMLVLLSVLVVDRQV